MGWWRRQLDSSEELMSDHNAAVAPGGGSGKLFESTGKCQAVANMAHYLLLPDELDPQQRCVFFFYGSSTWS